MRHALVLFVLLALGASVQAGEPQKILMVGNSLTYTWDIPTILERFATEAKKPLTITRHLAGGKSLAWHWANQTAGMTVAERIAKGGFDLVILQDHSITHKKADARAEFERITVDYQKAIVGAKMAAMFYMPMLRDGDLTADKVKPLAEMYTKQADALGMACAPVALAFQLCNEKHPKLALIDNQTDRTYAQNKGGTHQSPFGSYLAACTLWAAIYHQSPVGFTFRAAFDAKKEIPISEADAKAAQEVAWQAWQDYAKQRPGAAAKAKAR